jgi:endonuclease-3
MLDLQDVVAELERRHPRERALARPLDILMWEAVGYLIDDDRREALFGELERRVGIDARAILAADPAVLREITGGGGMHPDKRARRIVDTARLVADACDGDLEAALEALPLSKARTLLKRFPGMGDPGADRILLFGGYAALPAVDSNGLRVLVRLGFCVERPNWSQTYRDAVRLIADRGRPDADWLKSAYLVLRAHGKELCKRSAPICLPCPFDAGCAHSVTSTL